MKILQKGSIKGIWRKQITCSGEGRHYENANNNIVSCGANLEINARDIFTIKHEFWRERTSYEYLIECPCCGALTKLKEKELPAEVRIFAETRTKDDVKNDNYRFEDYTNKEENEVENEEDESEM